MNSIEVYQEQLKQDSLNLEMGLKISDTALLTPRVNSGLDKATGIGHDLARALYPAEDKDRVRSYIAYNRLLSKLRKAYRQQLIDENPPPQADPYREVRTPEKRELFESLMDEGLSDGILNPTPMPVDVAPIEDLEPIYSHLSTGVAPIEECKEFVRGAYYDDGRIDLCKQVVGEPHIGGLVESVYYNPHVEHFLLGNNIVGDEGAYEISRLMKKADSIIKTYYIAGNCISAEGTAYISEAMKNNRAAESLWLKRNPIKPEGARLLGQFLEENHILEILDLVNTGILDEGVISLFNSLKKNKGLRYLYLDANGITPKGGEAIADYFDFIKEENRMGLTALYMSINRMGDEGTMKLAESIENYKHLERLDLSSNRMQNKGLKRLLEACSTIDKLKYLGIGLYKSTSDLKELPNYFDGEGVDIIADFLKQNNTVQVLELKDVNLRPGAIEVLTEAVESNDSLCDIAYTQFKYKVPEELMARIDAKLKANIQRQFGMDMKAFQSSLKREIKHGDKIRYIDSIYRNNMKDCHVCSS